MEPGTCLSNCASPTRLSADVSWNSLYAPYMNASIVLSRQIDCVYREPGKLPEDVSEFHHSFLILVPGLRAQGVRCSDDCPSDNTSAGKQTRHGLTQLEPLEDVW
jgi:hypothetical protein